MCLDGDFQTFMSWWKLVVWEASLMIMRKNSVLNVIYPNDGALLHYIYSHEVDGPPISMETYSVESFHDDYKEEWVFKITLSHITIVRIMFVLWPQSPMIKFKKP